MSTVGNLSGKVIFLTGGSRGIGRSIALRAARDGAKVVIAARSKESHRDFPGTIYSVAQEIEKCGGYALPCAMDVCNEDEVRNGVEQTVKRFGGIDILVNNASVISLTNTSATPMSVYDSLMDINMRGTFICSKLCIPYLKKSSNAHILNISPPLNMSANWFSNHLPYTLSKYGMSMCVLGMAKELQSFGIAVNALWPRSVIYTLSTKMIGANEKYANHCRYPEIMSDAAYIILNKQSRLSENTGQFFVDEDILRKEGVTNFDKYSIKPGTKLNPVFYLDIPKSNQILKTSVNSSKQDDQSQQQSIQKIFAKIEKLVAKDVIEDVNASYCFQLSGSEPGEWFLDLKSAKVNLGRLNKSNDCVKFDCYFKLTSENFVQMFEGRLLPTTAFMSGDLSVQGNVLAALKLEKLLKKLLLKSF